MVFQKYRIYFMRGVSLGPVSLAEGQQRTGFSNLLS
jgi:hypothetical protein